MFGLFQKKNNDSCLDLLNLLIETYGHNYQKIQKDNKDLSYHLFKGEKENIVVCFFSLSLNFIPTTWAVNNHYRVAELKKQGYKIDRLIFVSEGKHFNLDLFDLEEPRITWKSLAKSSKENILYDILQLTNNNQ